MKRNLLAIALFCLLGNCHKNQVEEVCSHFIRVEKTNFLSVSDSIPSFAGTSESGKNVNPYNLQGKFLLIFFKKKTIEHKNISLFNDEFTTLDIGKVVMKDGGNIIVCNDLKLARIFGLKESPDHTLESSYLFIANKDKLITRIYKDVCEKEMVSLINSIR